ncbi:DUF1194 domain-containing protein [Fodinicurvata sediminis]|uniref:DUF1194 domain-containing protein n=1 Tax=Fodinicurvata sediminis TaxID=1121832 RepID=UPI0003B5C7B5|nr:DUF1194 domain-containing protein [Fodinicurvata sediminis]
MKTWPHLFWLLAFLLLAPLMAAEELNATQQVDLQLLLAVDSSSSIDAREFDLQMRGYAEAFRSKEVQNAIRGVGDLGVAVAMVHWAGEDEQVIAQDWQLLVGAEDSVAFADQLDQTPRYVRRGSTAIGNMFAFAHAMVKAAPYAGRRQVIDVSGDGESNKGIPVARGRASLLEQRITINGLAILNEEPALDIYYQQHVIGGAGAFLISSPGFEEFGDAIRQKILRELEGAPLSMDESDESGPRVQFSQHK